METICDYRRSRTSAAAGRVPRRERSFGRRWADLCLAVCIAFVGFHSGSRAQDIEERLFWESVSACTERDEVELYPELFPGGDHVAEARDCLEALGLLDACAEHFRADRLTTGAGGTALACYREVLRLQPGNYFAEAGLQRIVERYVEWSSRNLARGDCGRATRYLDLARTVGTGFGIIDSQAAEIDRHRSCQGAAIDFGDDTGSWPRDGECDDFRFTGPGASDASYEELGKDASDCRMLLDRGQVWLHPLIVNLDQGVNYGDDASDYAWDGECDDPRFVGSMVPAFMLIEDLGHDATDCRQLHQEGRISIHPLMGGL